METRQAEEVLVQELLTAIAALPGFSARIDERASARDHGADFVLKLGGRASAQLVVECTAAGALYPRDVSEWLWKMREQIDQEPSAGRSPRILVLAANSLSPGVKAILKEHDVGYYDRGGSLFLPLPDAFVLIDKPAPKRAAPERSLFTDRRALVLHALLRRPQQPISVNPLAAELELSVSTVSDTLSLLDRMEWTQSEGSGPAKRRLLTEPRAVLDAWGEHVVEKQPLKIERYFTSGRDAAKIAEKFEAACTKWKMTHAFTGELAGQALAPLLSSISVVRCRVPAGEFLDPPLDELGVQAVSEGANLECIRSSPGELTFIEKAGELTVASPIQIYLDLLRLPGRAKELGAHLRRVKIGF